MPTTARPIFVVRLAEATWRQIGDDCGGRPRQWVDEHRSWHEPAGAQRGARASIHFSGRLDDELIAAYASNEMMMPAYLPGTAPIATPDQIILVLGDFRGDVWLMNLQ